MESENSSAVKNTRSKGVAQSIQSKKITTTPAMGRVQQAPSFLQYRSPVDRRCISEVGNENLRRFLSRIPRSPANPQPIRSANVRPLNGQTKSSGKVQPEKPLDDGGCIQEDDDDDDEIISDQEKNEDEKKKENEE